MTAAAMAAAASKQKKSKGRSAKSRRGMIKSRKTRRMRAKRVLRAKRELPPKPGCGKVAMNEPAAVDEPKHADAKLPAAPPVPVLPLPPAPVPPPPQVETKARGERPLTSATSPAVPQCSVQSVATKAAEVPLPVTPELPEVEPALLPQPAPPPALLAPVVPAPAQVPAPAPAAVSETPQKSSASSNHHAPSPAKATTKPAAATTQVTPLKAKAQRAPPVISPSPAKSSPAKQAKIAQPATPDRSRRHSAKKAAPSPPTGEWDWQPAVVRSVKAHVPSDRRRSFTAPPPDADAEARASRRPPALRHPPHLRVEHRKQSALGDDGFPPPDSLEHAIDKFPGKYSKLQERGFGNTSVWYASPNSLSEGRYIYIDVDGYWSIGTMDSRLQNATGQVRSARKVTGVNGTPQVPPAGVSEWHIKWPEESDDWVPMPGFVISDPPSAEQRQSRPPQPFRWWDDQAARAAAPEKAESAGDGAPPRQVSFATTKEVYRYSHPHMHANAQRTYWEPYAERQERAWAVLCPELNAESPSKEEPDPKPDPSPPRTSGKKRARSGEGGNGRDAKEAKESPQKPEQSTKPGAFPVTQTP